MIRSLLLILAAADMAAAGPLLFAIGADTNGVPNQLVSIDTNTGSHTTLATLGNGSTSFAGGIQSLSPGQLAGFQSDSNAQSFVSFYSTAGVIGAGFPMGTFLPGGLYLDPSLSTSSWVANDGSGNWQLNVQSVPSVSGSGALASGLAYNPANNAYYVVVNDSQGNSELLVVDPVAASVVNNIPLGAGFYGGVAWDPAGQQFYLIGTGNQGEASLYNYSLQGNGPNLLFGLGDQGFLFASLTVDADTGTGPASTPEPSTGLGISLGFGLLAWLRTRTASKGNTK